VPRFPLMDEVFSPSIAANLPLTLWIRIIAQPSRTGTICQYAPTLIPSDFPPFALSDFPETGFRIGECKEMSIDSGTQFAQQFCW
jgi:hypothetical protein